MNQLRWKLLSRVMRGNRLLYIGAILAAMASVIVEMTTPLMLRMMFDNVIGTIPTPSGFVGMGWLLNLLGGRDYLRAHLYLLGVVWIIVSGLEGGFSYLRARWTAKASESIALNLRNTLYDHLQHLTYDYHVKAETGDLIQRCTSDVDTIRRFLSGQLVEIFRTAIMLVIALSLMFSLSTPMSLVSLILMPVLFVFSFLYFRMVIRWFRDSDEAEGAMSATLQENLTGVRVVRAFGREQFEREKFREKNDNFLRLGNRLMGLLAFYWSFSDILTMVQTAAVLCFGVYMATLQPAMYSVGLVTAFLMYVSRMLWPIRQLGRILADFGKSLVSLDRLNEILTQPREAGEDEGIETPINRDIVFENVDFAYESSHPILKGLNFSVKRGSTIAILGATGSGKSTMMYLLQRLYEPSAGRITIGGVDIREIRKDWLRAHVGVVLQEPFLYSKKIRDNIAIVNPSMSDEDVFQAAGIASIHDVILGFEKGYETEVGERGVTLSGGQKQRVAIARTLVRDNDILIFDDSLSAVDTETDAAIRAALKKRDHHATTFIISHRITTLSEADQILVLEDGHIVQQGTHEELIRMDGLYKRINGIQTELEDELAQEEA